PVGGPVARLRNRPIRVRVGHRVRVLVPDLARAHPAVRRVLVDTYALHAVRVCGTARISGAARARRRRRASVALLEALARVLGGAAIRGGLAPAKAAVARAGDAVARLLADEARIGHVDSVRVEHSAGDAHSDGSAGRVAGHDELRAEVAVDIGDDWVL